MLFRLASLTLLTVVKRPVLFNDVQAWGSPEGLVLVHRWACSSAFLMLPGNAAAGLLTPF